RGKEPERAAHVDVRLYGTCPFALKAEFTRAVYKLLNETTGLQDDEVYVEIAEYGTWGTQGDLK
ncbi:MAG: hypothetical protein LBQ21_03415, partial [Clostridiales Family XIII bacterium]|nr:hypothetical protein [Clostridiales Family XIII bacterium]